MRIQKNHRFLFLLQQAFTVVSLFIFSRAVIFHVFARAPKTGVAGAGEEPTVISQPGLLWLYLAIYCITGLLTIASWREILYFFYREKFIAILLALAALSAVWSAVPMETLAKSVAICGCTLFGYHFASRYSPRQQLRLMAIALAMVIIASFVTAIFYPDAGIMQGIHQGLWRGAFPHKNMLGTTIPLASISFFLLAASARRYTFLCWTGFWLSLILLMLACSKGALVIYCLVFLALGFYLLYKDERTLGIVALISVIIAGGSFGLQYKFDIFPPIVVSEIAKQVKDGTWEIDGLNFKRTLASARAMAPESADFSTGHGRINLWTQVVKAIGERPWLGYGLGGFWLGADGPSGLIWSAVGWQPPSGHNGLLDLCLHLGVLGLGLFLCSFSIAGYRLIRPLFSAPFDPVALFMPTILAYVMLANIGESDLFSVNYILWICFVASVVSTRLYSNPEFMPIEKQTYTAA